jgi:HK97 family phage prohead protease
LDFKLYTNALKVRETDNGDLYVSGTTSSTIRDRQGDEITLDAIKSMADTAKQNMTVFLNHNYNVPEDLFGSVTDARIVKRLDADTGLDVYDLDIDIKVCPEDENPAAMQAYKAIKRGVKLGMSIGARVEKVSKRKDSSGLDTYVIEKVNLLESSIVGIPANQRSYLQNALKSLRSADQAGELGDALKAAPDALKEGDFARWNSSGGDARGRIEHVMREGTLGVPDSDFSIEASPEDPAALIRIYKKSGNGWKETETLVGHKFSTLSKIDPLTGDDERGEGDSEKSAVNDSVVHEADGSYEASGADVIGGEPSANPSTEEIAPAPEEAASAGNEVENVSDTLEKATRVTVTVSGQDGKERELPIPASSVPEPVIEEKGAMPVADRLKNVVGELDSVKSEEANEDRAKYIEYAAGWVQAYLEYEAAPAVESVEAGIVDETTKSLDHHVEATETPAEEADLAVVAEEAVASVPAEEVVVENTAATELLEEKEQLEKDLEHAVKLLELALKSPVGRKSILTDVPAKKQGIDAPWLSPYIQAILEKK